MSVPSPKQRKAPSHVAAVASTAKAQHHRYRAAARSSTAQLFQSTGTHTEKLQPYEVPVSILLGDPRLLWQPELRSCLPDTLLQRASPSPGSTSWTCTAQAAVLPRKSHFQPPALGLPWLQMHTGRRTVVPCLSSLTMETPPAELLPTPAAGPAPETTFSKAVSNFSTAVSHWWCSWSLRFSLTVWKT